MGFFTTGEVASAAGVTTQTIRSWLDSGLLDCSTSDAGHRRVHDSAMSRVQAANEFIEQHLESSASRGELVGAVLRLFSIPAPQRLGAPGFVQGFLVARLGTGVTIRVKNAQGREVQQ